MPIMAGKELKKEKWLTFLEEVFNLLLTGGESSHVSAFCDEVSLGSSVLLMAELLHCGLSRELWLERAVPHWQDVVANLLVAQVVAFIERPELCDVLS